MRIIHVLFILFISIFYANNDIYKEIQTELILANDGDIIQLPLGVFNLSRSLWAENLNNVTIQGRGIDSTILSFENQIEGAEGIKIINSNNMILKDFTVQNSIGDLIKVEDTEGIEFLNIKAQWTGGADESNGSYAFYPVKSKNVLIDGCIAIGASDAGIYVGQSENIIVKNSEAYYNVAGIEIENSVNADVYNNYTHNNSGGVLIFDLPDLLVKKGSKIRVFNNKVIENNIANFAPDGNIVAKVPSGTGIMILAASKVEVFNNIITNNKTANTCIASYYLTEEPITDSLYYPYPTSIYLHDNIYHRDKQFPSFSFSQPIGFLLAYNFWRDIPDIIYDGILDSMLVNKKGDILNEYKICIKNNKGADFLNLDAGNNFNNMSQNLLHHDCSFPNIAPVQYPFKK